MVEYRVLSTFVSGRLNTDLKDFTLDCERNVEL